MNRISFTLILLTTMLLPIFSAQAERSIAFKPPQLGSPEARTGGGTRSLTEALKQAQPQTTEQIELLASNQTGLSSISTPTLYWYASSVPTDTIEITVQLINEDKPLLKKNIGKIKTAGIQAIRLADYGVKLTNGKNYTWSVTLTNNNAVADATIRYEPTTMSLTDVAQMTTAGYWYDAVTQLVASKSPQLSEILQQEGISITTDK